MRRQKGLRRYPRKQRRVMSGHWGYDQHARLRHAQTAASACDRNTTAGKNGFSQTERISTGGSGAVDLGVGDAPFGLAVAARRPPRNTSQPAATDLPNSVCDPRIERILKQDFCGVGHSSRRIERGLRNFVHPVHRRGKRRTAIGHQGAARRQTSPIGHLILKSFCIAAYCRMRNKASMYRSAYLRERQAEEPSNSWEVAYFATLDQPNHGGGRCAKSARNIANDAIRSTTLISRASIIRSAPKHMADQQRPHPPRIHKSAAGPQATYCSQCGSSVTG